MKLSQSARLYFIAEGTDTVYADVEVDGHVMTLPVAKSRGFHHWLLMRYFDEYQRAPNREAFKNAIDTIEARAIKNKIVLPVHVRRGWHNGRLYLDRWSDDFSVIEADGDGCRVIPQAPIKFIRPSNNAGVLPIPERGGSIEDLQKFVNLAADRDFYLYVGFILSCYLEDGEFPLGLFLGPHGSAKTTAVKRACALIDPILKDPPGPARTNQDVLVNAQTSHVQPMDNVKHVGVERSAIYCRMLTGGQERSRTLFTNADAFILVAHKPIAMSATIMVVTEEDLTDRTILLRMGKAFENGNANARKSKKQIDREFNAAWPKLLGAILDGVSAGLRNAGTEPTNPLPRLADAAIWCWQCEPGLGWPQGRILTAWNDAIEELARDVAELDPVAAAVMALMVDRPKWESPAAELLNALATKTTPRITKTHDWPANAAVLGQRLRALSSVFSRNGVSVSFRHNGVARLVTLLRRTANGSNGSDAAPTLEPPAGPSEPPGWVAAFDKRAKP